MAVTWTINQLDRSNADGVLAVHWRASEVSTVGDVDHTGQSYGTCSFTPDPAAEGYIPWSTLSKENVVAWVKEQLGEQAVAAIEASIAAQITESKEPTVLFGFPEGWSE